MKYILLIVFIFLLFSSCYQQRESDNKQSNIRAIAKTKAVSNVVNDSTIYQFINFMIKAGGPEEILTCGRIADREIFESAHTENDSTDFETVWFSKEDIDFIQKQLEARSDFKLDPKLVVNKALISTDTLNTFVNKEKGSAAFWSSYKEKYGNEGFCSISMPLFSVDKQTVVFHISYFCGGMCGHGGTYIYKKKKGRWTIVKELSSWIS